MAWPVKDWMETKWGNAVRKWSESQTKTEVASWSEINNVHLGVLVQAKFVVQLAHGHLVEVLAVSPGIRLRLVIRLQEEQKVSELSLLKETHERWVESFLASGRDLLGLAVLEHVTAVDALELKVASDLNWRWVRGLLVNMDLGRRI
jgi:hypothetical protein